MNAPTYPDWVDQLSERRLVELFGEVTLARGQEYVRQGRVGHIAMGSGTGGTLIQSQVRGSAVRAYQTVARYQADSATISTSCSCPIGHDCKHGAALLWHLRTMKLRDSIPPWQRALAQITAEAPSTGGQRLAIRVTLAPSGAIQLRPTAWGKSGKWMRHSATWESVLHPWGGDYLEEHRVPLAGLARTREQRATNSFYGQRADVLELGQLDASAWSWLARAVDAGVELLPGQETPPLRLLREPARIAGRLSRSGADLVLQTFATSGTHEWPVLYANVLGSPPHGLAITDNGELLLVPFAEPLSSGQQALLVQHSRLEIPASDIPSFAAQFHPTLRRLVDLETEADVELPETAPPRLLLQVDFAADHVTRIGWAFRYQIGGEGLDVDLYATGDLQAYRDLPAEQVLLDALPAGPWPIRNDRAGRHPITTATLTGPSTADFVSNWLERLRELGVIVEVTGQAQAYHLASEAPRIDLAVTDAGPGTDWFNLAVTVSIEGEPVEYRELFTALATGQTHLILPSGTWFSLERPELEQLKLLIQEAGQLQPRDAEGLQLRAVHAGLWDDLRNIGVVAEQSVAWTAAVSALLETEELPRLPVPTGLKATLRPYQELGFRWLHFLHGARLGGILADDMGLGKTLQVIALACALVEEGRLDQPLLVVAPTSVLGTWAAEAARFAPGLRVRLVEQSSRKRMQPVADLAADADIVVTSYTLLRLDEEEYVAQAWSAVFLDEAQFVKNRQSRAYQAVRKLRASAKFAVTGTPLENNLMDLWSLLSIVAPGLFTDPVAFTTNYRRPIESGTDPSALARLHRRVRPLMLRRAKEDVAQELPPKQEQVLRIQLSPSHRRLYDKQLAAERKKVLGLVDDLRKNRITILSSLTLLRQLALSPALVLPGHAAVSAKLDTLVELVAELAAEGHRALVFSQFTSYLGLAKDRLQAEGIGASYLDGRTRDRAARIEAFRSGSDPVFLISLKAGGFGLTLTEADYVFILDPWWNPAAELQAIDRTHRIGQEKHVMVYRLVSEDTIEEKVVALQERKRDLFAMVVGEGGDLAAPLTADDIRSLLEPTIVPEELTT
ncbi:MAG: SNF2-related protein [Propionicimonas sp.]